MRNHLQIPLILILASLTSIVSSQQWAPGLPEGTPFPNINAVDQHGKTWTNKTLIGKKGLIFFFVRSSDWCPFCKKQLVELSEKKAVFDALGVNVAAMSYDTNATNSKFADRYSITFPLLADKNTVHVNAFGIRNDSYAEGHRAYGVPLPGVFLVDGDGNIYSKFAEQDYRQRPAMELVIESATNMAADQD